MRESIVIHVANLKRSTDKMLTAHQAIEQGIADHAEKHATEVDARRAALVRDRAIQEGIRRNSSGV